MDQPPLRPAHRGGDRRVHLVIGEKRLSTPISIWTRWKTGPSADHRRVAGGGDGRIGRETPPALFRRLANESARAAPIPRLARWWRAGAADLGAGYAQYRDRPGLLGLHRCVG